MFIKSVFIFFSLHPHHAFIWDHFDDPWLLHIEKKRIFQPCDLICVKQFRVINAQIFFAKTGSLKSRPDRFWQGHQELSGKSDENKSFKSNQLAPSIYIMIELCFFSLDQWEIRIHLLWGKCFNFPHWSRSQSTNER